MRLRTLHAVLLAAVAATASFGSLTYANDYDGNDDCENCRHHHLHKHHHYIEGRDPSYNCGCNGSYKFPVPPLYTYHWPGMYSQQRMTDYHSPWRYPPIRPYVDDYMPIPVKTDAAPAAPHAETSRMRLSPVPR